MFYAVVVPPSTGFEAAADGSQETQGRPHLEELIFEDIKLAAGALKRFKGARMKIFDERHKALDFLRCPERLDESFVELDSACGAELASSLANLSLQSAAADAKGSPQKSSTPTGTAAPDEGSEFPSAKPDLLNRLRRRIEAGDHEEVEQIVWSNPRSLVTVTDSAVYLMAGWKYNACHVAARSNKPDIMALILDTVSNLNFLKKLYPNERPENLQVRSEHLLDSYLNTPDPKQGNTPLHFACKLGHYKVVRVLLTYEACDTNLKDLHGKTAEEGTCTQFKGAPQKQQQQQDDDNNTQAAGANTSLPAGDISLLSNSLLNMSLNGLASQPASPQEVAAKIREMFRCQLHLPSYRDQLKKRLLLEKRRKKAGLNFDSDTSFSDDSFTLPAPPPPPPATNQSTPSKQQELT